MFVLESHWIFRRSFFIQQVEFLIGSWKHSQGLTLQDRSPVLMWASSDDLTTSSCQQLSKSELVQTQSTTRDFCFFWREYMSFWLQSLSALNCRLHCFGFRPQCWGTGLNFRLMLSGFRVQDWEFNVWGSWIKVWNVGCRVRGKLVWYWGKRCKVQS